VSRAAASNAVLAACGVLRSSRASMQSSRPYAILGARFPIVGNCSHADCTELTSKAATGGIPHAERRPSLPLCSPTKKP
jgi:hypothetical protein